MKIILHWLIITGFLFLTTGCSDFPEERITKDFDRIFSEYKIIRAYPIEGDSDNVYYQIEYKNKNSNKVKKVIFFYQRNLSDNSWYLLTN